MMLTPMMPSTNGELILVCLGQRYLWLELSAKNLLPSFDLVSVVALGVSLSIVSSAYNLPDLLVLQLYSR